MRRVIIWSIVVLVVIGGALWMRGCNNVMETRSDLHLEVNEYCKSASENAAWTSFRLAESYLDDREKGRFEQRFRSLGNPDTVIGFRIPKDSYNKVMWDLADKLERWARIELNSRGEDYREDDLFAELVSKTPQQQIMELRDDSENIVALSHNLISDNKPRSVKAVEQVRAQFVEAKSKLEELLEKSRLPDTIINLSGEEKNLLKVVEQLN